MIFHHPSRRFSLRPFLRTCGKRLLEALFRRIYDARANLADTIILMSNTRVDDRTDARLNNLEQIDTCRASAEVQSRNLIRLSLADRDFVHGLGIVQRIADLTAYELYELRHTHRIPGSTDP